MRENTVKWAMTPFPYSIATTASLADARAMMVEHEVRHLPVTEGVALKGILTDRDLKFYMGPSLNGPEASTLIVRDVYIDDCYTVDMSTPLVEVLRHMAGKHIGAAVVTSNNRLAGIFTATDACRVLADTLVEAAENSS